jgi:CheY-like chemotaxis protein
MNRRVLLVDDDPNILSGYRRQLRREFDLATANSGQEGLDIIRQEDEFAAIVSDMNMPEMNGVQFLEQAQSLTPNSVRIMLTGNADQQTAINAINNGRIFRFLNKPCPPEALIAVLNCGLEQYRLVTAEKELLEETVTGSIRAMAEILSLASPLAFGRATRIQRLVNSLAKHFEIENAWELETAALLSQAGSVTVPESVLERALSGQTLSQSEVSMLRGLGTVAADLIRKIPRMEAVTEIIAGCFPAPEPAVAGECDPLPDDTPLPVQILQTALDFDTLSNLNHSPRAAVDHLRTAGRVRDGDLLDALEQSVVSSRETLEINLDELTTGQILAEEITSADGSMTLIGKGYEVTERLLLRLRNFSENRGIREPLYILGAEELDDASHSATNVDELPSSSRHAMIQ